MREPCEITAIIPTYNRAQLIGRAIDSALMQSTPPDQVLVLDDGSSDATGRICKEYGSRIDYVWQSNAGPSLARNSGIRSARHNWVAFLDSDDYWTQGHLERMKTAIRETNGEANFYFSNTQLADNYYCDTLWELIGFHPDPPFHLVRDASAWMLMKRQPTLLQSSVFRKGALEAVGGLSEKLWLSHDVQVFCKLGIGGTVCAVSGVGCIRTEEDRSNIRLSNKIPAGGERQLEDQCQLWQDVLDLQKGLHPGFQRLVRYNLAGSHLSMCKLRWCSGRFAAALGHLFRVMKSDPELVVWIARKSSSRGYEEKIRHALHRRLHTKTRTNKTVLQSSNSL